VCSTKQQLTSSSSLLVKTPEAVCAAPPGAAGLPHLPCQQNIADVARHSCKCPQNNGLEVGLRANNCWRLSNSSELPTGHPHRHRLTQWQARSTQPRLRRLINHLLHHRLDALFNPPSRGSRVQSKNCQPKMRTRSKPRICKVSGTLQRRLRGSSRPGSVFAI
jgi:hypothetical protein